MNKLFLKYNILSIIPFEKTFFYTTKLPKNVLFTHDLLQLNYSKHSPYKNKNLLSYMNNKQLMIWFYKEHIDMPFVVPESYILYKLLNKINTESCIYFLHDTIIKIIIIKDSYLQDAYCVENIAEVNIVLIMEEYQIFKIEDIDKDSYELLKLKSLSTLSYQDMYKFSTYTLNTKNILNAIINNASYPIILLILLAMLTNYIQGYILKDKISILEKEYILEKNQNASTKELIDKHNKEIKKWQYFIQKELKFVGPIILLDSIYNIFKKNEKAYLTSVSLNANILRIKIQTDMNPITFLNRLNDIPYFSEVIIQNTYKPKREMKIISFDIVVKLIKDI